MHAEIGKKINQCKFKNKCFRDKIASKFHKIPFNKTKLSYKGMMSKFKTNFLKNTTHENSFKFWQEVSIINMFI